MITIQEACRLFSVEQNSVPDKDTLKMKFKELAFQYHPDRGGNTENFNRVQEAYNLLLNHSNRGIGSSEIIVTIDDILSGGPPRIDFLRFFFSFNNEKGVVMHKWKTVKDNPGYSECSICGLYKHIVGDFIYYKGRNERFFRYRKVVPNCSKKEVVICGLQKNQ